MFSLMLGYYTTAMNTEQSREAIPFIEKPSEGLVDITVAVSG